MKPRKFSRAVVRRRRTLPAYILLAIGVLPGVLVLSLWFWFAFAGFEGASLIAALVAPPVSLVLLSKVLYPWWEYFVLMLTFGRGQLGKEIRKTGKEEYDDYIAMYSEHFWDPRALVAICWRSLGMGQTLRRLRNLEIHKAQEKYDEVLRDLIVGWRTGVPRSALYQLLADLSDIEAQGEESRLQGQAVTANITYLLGNLEVGRQLADQVMDEAKRFDRDRTPVFQWIASYAHINSRLFLGRFQYAASLLSQRWDSLFELEEFRRMELFRKLQSIKTTLNPIASVPRHMLLSHAFLGTRVGEGAGPNPPSEPNSWARNWYCLGVALSSCEKDKGISLHFTHAYAALYSLAVDHAHCFCPEDCNGKQDKRHLEVADILDQIPSKGDEPAPKAKPLNLGEVPHELNLHDLGLEIQPPVTDPQKVSTYVQRGVHGLSHLKTGEYSMALREFKRLFGDASQLASNRFLDGIFLPAYVVSLAHDTEDFEAIDTAKKELRKARKRSDLKYSAFYDALFDAAAAVIEQKQKRKRVAVERFLGDRAGRIETGLVGILYKSSAEVSESGA